MTVRWIRNATWALAALSLACAKPLPDQPPIQTSPLTLGADEWRVTDQAIVVTDASGTQYDNETFPQAKALSRSFIAAMPGNDAPARRAGGYEAGYTGFGGDERVGTALARFDRAALAAPAATLVPLGSIDGYGGETPVHDVLDEARAALAGGSGRSALVIFSDGLADDPGRALAHGQQLVEARPDICIHTVQTGVDPVGTDFLQKLSRLTSCGSHRNGNALRSSGDLHGFARTVFVGPAEKPIAKPAPPPPVPDPCKGVVRLRGIEFAFDRAEILPVSRPILDVVADQLRRCPSIRVRVDGHTDSIGSDAYNQGLSLRRAQATRNYLVGTGIDAGRLSTQGFGESRPVDTNDTAEGRARNRRVELVPQQ